MDWSDWHQRYDLSTSLAVRLRIVIEQIAAAIDECSAGPVTIVSLCAGDGRDVIGALAEHKRRADINAWLLDTHKDSLARGEALAEEQGLAGQLRFLEADAGLLGNYANIVPADIILLSGFLGHIRQHDIPSLIASLPMLCKVGGFVIWNKHLVANDGPVAVLAIREILARAQFEEIQFQVTEIDGYAVGRARFCGRSLELDATRVFFEFEGA
ncbi:hypothetical protein BH11VER1_BH11VER1_09820 [soil metagenome]